MEWQEDCSKEEEINSGNPDTPILYGDARITSDLNRGPATEPTWPRCLLTGAALTRVHIAWEIRCTDSAHNAGDTHVSVHFRTVDASQKPTREHERTDMTHPFDTTPSHDKKGGPVTHHDPGQQRSPSANTQQEVNTQQEDVDLILTNLHHRVTSVEPIARDLNRHLVDLLGPCPVVVCEEGVAGSWVTIVEDQEGNHLVQLPLLPVTEALRLSSALVALARETDFSDVRRSLPSSVQYHLPFFVLPHVTKVSGHVSAVQQ